MIRVLTLVVILSFVSGCNFQHDPVFETGRVRRVQLYSGNEKVREWKVTGPIEINSGGTYYFKDDETGQTISICGTVVIEVEKK